MPLSSSSARQRHPNPPRSVPSPASQRAARLSAGTLVNVEKQAHRDVKRAADDAIDQAVLAAQREKADNRKKLALLALLLWTSKDMEARVTRALVDARQASRASAASRLFAEFKAVGIRFPLQDTGNRRRALDQHHASSSAASLASAWRGRATAAVIRSSRRDEDAVAALEKTREQIVPSIARTTTTEIAQAWNDEKVEALDEALQEDEEFAAAVAEMPGLWRRWDAILDRRTCADCREHDGETAPIGGSFEGGDEPGFVHPTCRCLDTIVALP
jgi:hypothetical protein